MVYKATQKKSPSRKQEEPQTPKDDTTAVSVDDLVGGKGKGTVVVTGETLEAPKVAEEAPREVVPPVAESLPPVNSPDRGPMEKPYYSARRPMPMPRRDFNGGPSRFGGNGRGGYGAPRFDRGGYDRPEPSYRQPQSDPAEGNGSASDSNIPTQTVHGILDIMPEGHGFLRPRYTPSDQDIYISQSQIRRFMLRNGDLVEGQARPPKDNERYWGLLKVEKINEQLSETMIARPRFEDLVPVYPNTQLRLETEQQPLSTRIIDLVAPIGFGQRGLVVSPPKAGKTTILKEIAHGISANYPNVHLMAALIGERPEEVTDIARNVKGEVYASNFDESPDHQTRVAEVALDRAKRLVEMGRDVVILLDSITRLARAYNLVVNPSGRTLSGGFDPAALYPAKRFLGAARCVELSQNTPGGEERKSYTPGGSLTIIGTALVETGSRMDDLIYEEFKGTGNMELHLSRGLQERRIFPAIDLTKSGTRHDELLLGEDAMRKITTLRHMLTMLSEEERTLMLIDRLSKSKLNAEFLETLNKG